MPKFHINPVTGDPRPCNAVKRPCKYAKAGEPHFDSKEDARKAFEQKMSTPEGWLENKILAGITDSPRDSWRYYDAMEVHALPNGEILAVEKQHSFWSSGPESSEIWLVDSSGEAVGFAKVIDHDERDECQLVLADIEIRPEYRERKSPTSS